MTTIKKLTGLMMCAALVLAHGGSVFSMGGEFNVRDHALPRNSIRTKLDSIFRYGNRDLGALANDWSWQDLQSWHWLIGFLTTAGGNTQFVAKAAKHPAGVFIRKPGMGGVTHAATQNISRVRVAAKVRRLIQENGLTRIRVPGSWVYPVSGNDADLSRSDLTDHDVVIVEEKVESSGRSNQCLRPSDYAELVTLAQNGIYDLHPGNFVIDEEGKMALIDLEDLMLSQREAAENSNRVMRPLRQWLIRSEEKGGPKLAVGMTGISQFDPDLIQQGGGLMVEGICDMARPQIIAFKTGAAVAAGLGIRHMYYARKTNLLINECCAQIERAINAQKIKGKALAESVYMEAAKNIVAKLVPNEKREEVIRSFAIMAIAQDAKNADKSAAKKRITILGTEFMSPDRAIERMRERIYTIWASDWSVRSKISRGVMAARKKVGDMLGSVKTYVTQKARNAYAAMATSSAHKIS